MADSWLYPWALGSVAFGGASLLVPLYAVQMGASALQLGLLASVAAIAGAPGAILFGRLADRAPSRRPLVVGTLGVVAACLTVIPFLSEVTAIIAANAVLWLVVAAVAPVLTMIVVDATPQATWPERIGRLNKFQGYGWAVGLLIGMVWPVVAGGLLDAGTATRALFWTLAACGVASAVWAVWTLPEPDRHITSPGQIRRVNRLLARSRRGIRSVTVVFSPNRLYWSTRTIHPARLREQFTPALATYLLAAGLFLTGSAAFWAPLPLVLAESGFDDGLIFGVYLLASLGSAVLYEPAGKLASRYGFRRLQTGALVVRGVALLAVALATGVGAVALRFGLIGVGLTVIGATWGVIAVVGAAMVTTLAPPAIRGEALGIYAALGAVAGAIGGVLGGWVAEFGYLLAFAVATALVLASAGLVASLRGLAGPDASDEPTTESSL